MADRMWACLVCECRGVIVMYHLSKCRSLCAAQLSVLLVLLSLDLNLLLLCYVQRNFCDLWEERTKGMKKERRG